MRILLVEDDDALGRTLARGLREHAYAVDLVADGESALEFAAINSYDAFILDVMLPRLRGFDVCARLRDRKIQVPILMLTARDAVRDRIEGLDSGADDYLTKPFDFDELLARLRALLRRRGELLPAHLVVADLVLNTRSQTAARNGRHIDFTPKEYAFLEYLARNAGRVISRSDICAHVWDDNHDPLSNSIEVHVGRLRRKIDGPGEVPLIQTRRGAGYLLGAIELHGASEVP